MTQATGGAGVARPLHQPSTTTSRFALIEPILGWNAAEIRWAQKPGGIFGFPMPRV